ncbi:MAG: arginase family protein [Planctomycetes bacterium]|nr:arginase family protein [Planctomycetota bacterium]
MKKYIVLLIIVLAVLPIIAMAQQYKQSEKIQVAIVKNPFGAAPSIIEEGLPQGLQKLGCEIVKDETFSFTPEEQQYRGWTRDALASRHLANLISVNGKNEYFTVALLNSCADLPGILGGLQHQGPGVEKQIYHLAADIPHRVGLIYLDAHADVNTPETTLSGMYGGMDVALAAGLYHPANRMIAGLDPPLPPSYIVLGDVRDTDPREEELIKRYNIEIISTSDIINLTDNVTKQMERLSSICDLIYIHIDMDVLAPEEVRGHNLTAPDGPTSDELAACLELMFAYPKAACIGIASTPYGPRDPGHISRRAAVKLVEAAIKGVKKR